MLNVEGLSFGFRNQLLFKKISFSVQPGELLHIAGANGAGKTSLLNVLAALFIPQEGRMALSTGVSREYLGSEANAHFLHMTAVENLQFWTGLRGRKLSAADCEGILATWHFPKAAIRNKLPVGQFSTGMKRKLSLIRLECSQAQIWLADEPILGLDQASVALFVQALRAHLARGGACILTSHDMTHFEALISKSIFLENQVAT